MARGRSGPGPTKPHPLETHTVQPRHFQNLFLFAERSWSCKGERAAPAEPVGQRQTE